jgi:ribosomal protein L18E
VEAVFTIKVKWVSKSAKDKITEAGGEVLTLNELNKE